MPKILRTAKGEVRRVIMPSSTCNACKGTGQFRFSNGTEAVCTNCSGKGRFDFGR
jgi:DnaJ-class molecular chaperone